MAASFIVAIVVAVITVLVAAMSIIGSAMSDAPSTGSEEVVAILVSGFVLAALIAGSHFLPHFTW